MISPKITLFMSCMIPQIDSWFFDYLNYHQSAGVDHIAVYLDAEKQSHELPSIDGVSWHFADAAFFERKDNHDINNLSWRQRAVMEHAASKATELGYAFYAHIDSDELLFSPEGLSNLLSDLHPNAKSVLLTTLEALCVRATTEPATGFQCTTFIDPVRFRKLVKKKNWLGRILLGRRFQFAPFATLGHPTGKSIYRLPIAYPIWNQHMPDEGPDTTARFARLLHFDNSDYEQWKLKWQRRTSGHQHASGMSPVRRSLATSIQQALRSERATAAFYAEYVAMGPLRVKLLHRLGIVHRIVAFTKRNATGRTET